MTIEQTIKKAIKGGWEDTSEPTRTYSEANALAFIDPLFWQSLGKAMGWYEYKEIEIALPREQKHREAVLARIEENEGVILRIAGSNAIVSPFKNQEKNWKEYWHDFIDSLASGKSAESFFEPLTN